MDVRGFLTRVITITSWLAAIAKKRPMNKLPKLVLVGNSERKLERKWLLLLALYVAY